ncbi:MAG: hypothetical protein KDE53_32625, partial [Caldilineaceae bacterium]|nr:hypothetical protein [Caldilineaceae bacterium]
ANATTLFLFAGSPLLVLAIYFVGQQVAGTWLARASALALLAWIAYVLNNVIEAVIFSSYVTSPWFNLIAFTPAVLLCAGVTAWLFPTRPGAHTFIHPWRTHFAQRTRSAWRWRLPLAAVSFMPIYYGFGLLVVPFVGDYYQQEAFGLAQPPLATLLGVLLLRSVLFAVACLPVIAMWQGTRLRLWLRLGFALFVMVGLLYMLAATWLPPQMRFIHSLEILADSFAHAGVLVWLLAPGPVVRPRSTSPHTNRWVRV